MSSVHHDVTTPAPPRVEEVGDGVLAHIQPVQTLINTHHHGDHSYGNFQRHHHRRTTRPHASASWTRGSHIDTFWTEVEWGDIVVEPPFLTYPDSVTLWADDVRADVRDLVKTANVLIENVADASLVVGGVAAATQGTKESPVGAMS